MRFPTPTSVIALLLLESRGAFATNAFSSSGEVTACPGFLLSNTTSFNASFTPDNATLALDFSGLRTVPGNATLEFAIIADSDEAYRPLIDPCSVASLPQLCPASEGTLDSTHIDLDVPEESLRSMNLSADADVKAQLWLYISVVGGSNYTACVETTLHSNATENGSESTQPDASGSNDGTAGNGNSDSNSTSNDDAGSANDTTQDSSAGTLQAVGYLSL